MSVFGGQSLRGGPNILIDSGPKAKLKASRSYGHQSGKREEEGISETSGYRGILGFPIGFDAKGDVVGASIFVYQVQNGEFVPVAGYSASVSGR